MSFDWKSIVRTAAPVVGGLIGGPMGGVAISALAEGLLGDESKGLSLEEKTRQIEETLSSKAGPEILATLRKIDTDFKMQMKKLDIDLEVVHSGDRDSARLREQVLKDWTPRIMALTVTFGIFGILFTLIFVDTLPQDSLTLLNIMLGALSTAWISIIQYYFGSSKGTADREVLSLPGFGGKSKSSKSEG